MTSDAALVGERLKKSAAKNALRFFLKTEFTKFCRIKFPQISEFLERVLFRNSILLIL